VQKPFPTESFSQKPKGLDGWPFGKPHALTHCEGMGQRTSMSIQEQVGEHQAAVLLGLPMTHIRRFSRLAGLGHLEKGDRGEQVVFTYDELQRLCLLAAQSSK
jgi:hypothetical protein